MSGADLVTIAKLQWIVPMSPSIVVLGDRGKSEQRISRFRGHKPKQLNNHFMLLLRCWVGARSPARMVNKVGQPV